MTEAASGVEPGAAFVPGQVVAGRYELVELLGQGGHGAVYRAVQRPLGREVAIKMILVEAIYSGGMLERFAREAALVQRLEHPNTVRLFDYGTTEQGLPYIVFELLRGRTLEQELERGTLTPFRVGLVASQVLKSLMEAHALGIVHRDVKPSNVLLVDYSGETDFVKVLDFGVARNVKTEGEKPGITHDGQIIGTPSYMAPEQVRGSVVGPAADLHALGLVMAEATSGTRIDGAGSAMEIWMKQTSPDPVQLPHLVTSSALGPVIVRATRKIVSERYPSAEAMLDARHRTRGACAHGGGVRAASALCASAVYAGGLRASCAVVLAARVEAVAAGVFARFSVDRHERGDRDPRPRRDPVAARRDGRGLRALQIATRRSRCRLCDDVTPVLRANPCGAHRGHRRTNRAQAT